MSKLSRSSNRQRSRSEPAHRRSWQLTSPTDRDIRTYLSTEAAAPQDLLATVVPHDERATGESHDLGLSLAQQNHRLQELQERTAGALTFDEDSVKAVIDLLNGAYTFLDADREGRPRLGLAEPATPHSRHVSGYLWNQWRQAGRTLSVSGPEGRRPPAMRHLKQTLEDTAEKMGHIPGNEDESQPSNELRSALEYCKQSIDNFTWAMSKRSGDWAAESRGDPWRAHRVKRLLRSLADSSTVSPAHQTTLEWVELGQYHDGVASWLGLDWVCSPAPSDESQTGTIGNTIFHRIITKDTFADDERLAIDREYPGLGRRGSSIYTNCRTGYAELIPPTRQGFLDFTTCDRMCTEGFRQFAKGVQDAKKRVRHPSMVTPQPESSGASSILDISTF